MGLGRTWRCPVSWRPDETADMAITTRMNRTCNSELTCAGKAKCDVSHTGWLRPLIGCILLALPFPDSPLHFGLSWLT